MASLFGTRATAAARIERSIIPLASDADCPPIQVLAHAVSTLLRPTVAYALIPSLLDVLAQVEHTRQLVVDSSRALLSRLTKGEVMLGRGNDEEQREWRKRLRSFSSAQKAVEHRERYRYLAIELCNAVRSEIHDRLMWVC